MCFAPLSAAECGILRRVISLTEDALFESTFLLSFSSSSVSLHVFEPVNSICFSFNPGSFTAIWRNERWYNAIMRFKKRMTQSSAPSPPLFSPRLVSSRLVSSRPFSSLLFSSLLFSSLVSTSAFSVYLLKNLPPF